MCRQASDCDFEWRVATVMLNGESQVKDRESAMLNFIMAGYSSEGLSNHEQTRLMSWSTDGGLRGYHLARNPGLSFTTQHGAGAFPLSNEIPPPPSKMQTGAHWFERSRRKESTRIRRG